VIVELPRVLHFVFCSHKILFDILHWNKTWPTFLASFNVPQLTLILLTRRIGWAPNNASKWQMGFNSAFKGLTQPQVWHVIKYTNTGITTRTHKPKPSGERKKHNKGPKLRASKNSNMFKKILTDKEHPVFLEQTKTVEGALFRNTNRFPKYVYIFADRFCFLYIASRRIDFV